MKSFLKNRDTFNSNKAFTSVNSLGKVLVLNADYEPITVCNVEKAFTLIYRERAETVVESDTKKLRSATQEFKFPSVIKLITYIRMPHKYIPLTRGNILKRDNHSCQYCGKTKGELTVDHVFPKSKGGEDSWTNLTTACIKCNNFKGDRTPEEADMKLQRKPVRPNHVSFMKQIMGTRYKDWEPYLFH